MKEWFYLHKEYGICITFRGLIKCGISEHTLSMASRRGSKSWYIIDHPENKKIKLVVWKSISDNYKEKVVKSLGSAPEEFLIYQPIREMVDKDFIAEEFYRNELLKIKASNVIEKVKRYTEAASWLNMLVRYQSEKKLLRDQHNLTIGKLIEHTCTIIKSDKIYLPTFKRKLENKIKEYKKKKYLLIIHGGYENKNAAKIGKSNYGFDQELADIQKAFIMKAASMHNNFDAMQITKAVNIVFEEKDWPLVSHSLVYKIIKENRHIITPGRRGKRDYNSNISMQIKRKAPEFPLQYLTLDGWTVELLYQDETGYNNRLVIVIVLDACGKYPLGYAIGDRENVELIKQANRNAAQHIQELFGHCYRPRQIQSDNYGIKALTPFYEAMAHLHTPAAVGNAKAKIIEPYFKSLNKNYCQYQKNWSGFNITAKKDNQPNTEYLDKTKSVFPDRKGVEKQIQLMIDIERFKKREEYLRKWESLPSIERLEMKREDILRVFGKTTGFTNSITGQGLLPTINGTKYTYDTFDPAFRALLHVNWQVIYDDSDLSTILAISEDDKHHFVLKQKHIVSMDVHSMVPEDHQQLSDVRQFNKDREEEVKNTYAKNDRIVDEVLKNAPLEIGDKDEATTKLMFTYSGQQKEKLQDAKGLKKIQDKEAKRMQRESINEENNWQEMQRKRRSIKTDISQYLD